MATGDLTDCKARIIALLPNGWFTDSNPIRDALISGAAYGLSLVFSLLAYTQLQTRIGTATDGFLDLISYDFFGKGLPRKTAEQDAPFRQRILANLLRERATRKGLTDALVTLTGRAPEIFEPARPLDTGGLGLTLALGISGGIGSLLLNDQFFVTAYRPSSSGIPLVPGLGTAPCGLGVPGGAIVASLSWVQGYVTDTDIFAAVDAAKAAGTTAWTQLSN